MISLSHPILSEVISFLHLNLRSSLLVEFLLFQPGCTSSCKVTAHRNFQIYTAVHYPIDVTNALQTGAKQVH